MSKPTTLTNQSDDSGPVKFEWASDLQRQAVEAAPGPPLLLIGGYGSSKTSSAILHMLALCEAFPGYKIAVLRKTFKHLKETTRPSLEQWIDKKRTVTNTINEVVFDNGSSFHFYHLDDSDSATVLRGLEINAAFIDQAEEVQERIFETLLGRLGRWRQAKVPPWVLKTRPDWPWKEAGTGRPVPPVSCILTANPAADGDPELHWLWRRFNPDSQEWRDKWSKRGYRQLVFDSRSNKFASQQNIDILLEQNDDYIARYVRGEWVKPKGTIFTLHPESILEPDPILLNRIKNSMTQYRLLDHGDSSPTACLWISVDGEGRAYCWQEYYQGGTDSSGKEYNVIDHRRAITAMSRGLDIRHNLADPSIFTKTRNITGFSRKQDRWSVSDEYGSSRLINEPTAIIWKDADNNEELSRTRLRQYLSLNPKIRHPITGESSERGFPMLYFIQKTDRYQNGCEHVLQEVKAAKRLQVGERDGKPTYSDERDPDVPDHALDCVSPKTTICLANGAWVNAGDIREGMILRGFDEEEDHNGQRFFRDSLVEAASSVRKPSYRIRWISGGGENSIICSFDHQWLTNNGWIRTEDLGSEEILYAAMADGKMYKNWHYPVSKEFVGEQELMSIQTSTRTFIAEGLASHNCLRYFVNSRAVPAPPPVLPTEPKMRIVRGGGQTSEEGSRVILEIPPMPPLGTRARVDRPNKSWRSKHGGY